MRLRTLLTLGLAVLAGACQTVQSTDKAAVEYNRAFAKARDEITLLNVLRASAREPLQFSTISSVQGAVRAGASIRIPFINILAGGRDAISPELSFSARNPTVSIAPLATRDFIQGISRPLSASVIDDLLVQGWPLDVVLGLTVGGAICPDGQPRLNFGVDPDQDRRFLRAFRTVSDFGFDQAAAKPFAELRMSSKDALAALREGAGEQRRVVSLTPLPPGPNGSADALVKLVTPGAARIKGIDFREVCASGPGDAGPAPDKARLPSTGEWQGGVLIRSVFGIFQYLGKVHAADLRRQLARCREGAGEPGEPPLFRIDVSCGGRTASRHAVVATEFQGRRFVIPAAGQRPAQDRTLETLSLLTYLVDLQTSETAARSSVPFIAITQP
ncbi:MAG: hypothetical protein ABW194_06620 [Novosphingobium sp.]